MGKIYRPILQRAELALAITQLSLVGAYFALTPTPNPALARATDALLLAGVWLAAPLLGGLCVSRAVRDDDHRLRSVLVGVPGGVVLVTTLLNLRTVLASPGLFTYGGEGAFVGPFLALAVACLLAVGLLLEGLAVRVEERTAESTP